MTDAERTHAPGARRSYSAGGQRRNPEWMPATWFSRTWATATAWQTAGTCPGFRGDAAIMKTSPLAGTTPATAPAAAAPLLPELVRPAEAGHTDSLRQPMIRPGEPCA